jgi:dTDP-glucose pyrophosphorylase
VTAQKTVDMDTLQRLTNSEQSIHEKIQRHYQKKSDGLLHNYMLDKEFHFSIPDYFIVKTFENIICQDLDCDYGIDSCMLETMNIYLEKNKK